MPNDAEIDTDSAKIVESPRPKVPSQRLLAFLDSVVAGLVANAITATFIVIVALAGGRLQVLKGLSVFVLIILALGALTLPILAYRDYKSRQLDPVIAKNFGRLVMGAVLYAIMFAFWAWTLAQYLFQP